MKKCTTIILTILVLMLTINTDTQKTNAYGEVDIDGEVSLATDTISSAEYISWLNNWNYYNFDGTSNIVLTPGNSSSDMNFCWYDTVKATPAVEISTDKEFLSASKIFTGKSTSIVRSNSVNTYSSSNKVNVKNYLKPNTTYYYRYTSNYPSTRVEWSKIETFTTQGSEDFDILAFADPQIGASENISCDSFNWENTLNNSIKKCPNPAFIVSLGDQINYKTDDDEEGTREKEYAGFLYPTALRHLPLAPVIGNHETKGSDYKYHYNTPNSSDNYGKTPSGCDYYFSYNNALFIVLNTNNRNASSHKKLIKKAIKNNPDAKWRIALFHHDIYGSGAYHSNKTSTNVRAVIAPLMDEFNIDIALSRHDHSYTRSYSMINGTAITNTDNITNPVGTTYFTLGTSSGSKMYGLANPKQFYVKERSNNTIATYSVLSVKKDTLTLKTYDSTGVEYSKPFTLTKTENKADTYKRLMELGNLTSKSYTKKSFKLFNSARKSFNKKFHLVTKDAGADKISKYYNKSKDPLSYYGYRKGTQKAVKSGFSTLVDKTRKTCVKIPYSDFKSRCDKFIEAGDKLEKTSLKVTHAGNTLKNNKTITLKKGASFSLNIKKSPISSKIQYKTSNKSKVSFVAGKIKAKSKTYSRSANLSIYFENRVFKIKVKVI